jgi:hypothetical protein
MTNRSQAKSVRNKKSAASSAQTVKIDPLYVIFEQHLFNFADPEIDRRTLICKIIAEYLNYLRRHNISVPRSLEQPIVEELAVQVNTMLVKKIYGCFNLAEYQRSLTRSVKKRAKARYTDLEKAIKSPVKPSNSEDPAA